MKTLLTAAVLLVLTGCSAIADTDRASSPLQITALVPSYDSATGAVDLSINFTNISRVDMKFVQIEIAPFDGGGRRITSGDAGGLGILKLSGPFKSGEKVGPLVSKNLWFSSDIRCLEVVEVTTSGLDYSTTVTTGAQANSLVAANTRRICATATE